jgi:transmembrane sensor
MPDSKDDDVIWQTALEWIIRSHESSLDIATERELVDWLENNPAHRAAYDEAFCVWTLAGLVPRLSGRESGS